MTDTYTTLGLLEGHTLTAVTRSVDRSSDYIDFVRDDGKTIRMAHQQDCCESVNIEDVVGDLEDLVGSPLLLAEQASRRDDDASESGTWTFYRFRTLKGSVDIRWYGTSNGYYAEDVDLWEVNPKYPWRCW